MLEIFKEKAKGDVKEQTRKEVEKEVNLERDVADLQQRMWKIEDKMRSMCDDEEEEFSILD